MKSHEALRNIALASLPVAALGGAAVARASSEHFAVVKERAPKPSGCHQGTDGGGGQILICETTTKPRTSTTKPRTTTTQPRTTTKPTTGTTTRSTSGSTKTSSTSGGYGAGPSTTELVIDMDKDGYAAAEDADDNSPSTGFAGVTVAQETGINVDSATEEGKLNAWLLGTVEATNPAELDKLRRDYGAFGVKVLVEGEACAEGTVAQEVIPVATAGTEVASTTTTTLDTLPPQGSLAVEGFIAQGKVLDLPADPKDLVFHYFKCVVDNTVSQTTTPDTTFYAN